MKLHRNEKYFKWGLTAFLVIVAGGLFWLIFSNLSGFYDLILDFQDIISPLIYGCLFAYLMNPVMQLVQKLMNKALTNRKLSDKAKNRLSLTVSVVAAVIALLALLYALVALIVPNIVSSLEELLQQEKLERYGQTITNWINNTFAGTPVETWFHDNLDSLLQLLINELKKILDETQKMTDDEVKQKIREIADDNDVSLTETEISQILTLARTLEGLDVEQLRARAYGLADATRKATGWKKFTEGAKQTLEDIGNFFKDVAQFLRDLFSKWFGGNNADTEPAK